MILAKLLKLLKLVKLVKSGSFVEFVNLAREPSELGEPNPMFSEADRE